MQIPEDWTDETKEIYERMRASNKFEFGIFQSNLETAGYDYIVPAFEERTNYTVQLIADYVHLNSDGGLWIGNFTTGFMRTARCCRSAISSPATTTPI